MRLTDWLRPQSAYLNAARVDYPAYRARGIRLALLDIDNTLAEHGSCSPDAFAHEAIALIQKAGILPVLASNARKARAVAYAGELGIPVIPIAGKPLPTKIRKEMARLGYRKEETMLIGDQVFTDILCARLLGVHALLVRPRFAHEAWNVRVKRWLEKPFLKGVEFLE